MRMILTPALLLALAGCATPEPIPEAPRPIATYTFSQPPAAVTACFGHFISGASATPVGDGLRLRIARIPSAYAMIWSSVDGTRAEIFEEAPTHGGAFKVGFEQCETRLGRR